QCIPLFCLVVTARPPVATLFPYTTLFRSRGTVGRRTRRRGRRGPPDHPGEGGRPGRGTPRGDARGGTPPGTGRIQPRNDRVRTGRPAGGPDGRGRRHMGGPGRGQCPHRPPVAPAQPTDLAHPVGVGPDPAAAEGTPGRSFCRRDQRYGAGTGR